MMQVQAPAMSTPTPEQFFNNRGQDQSKPDINFLKNHFYREGRLTEEQALWIIEKATDILKKEPNVLSVDAPITGAPFSLFAGSKIEFLAATYSLWRHPWPICAFLMKIASSPHLLIPITCNSMT